MNYKIGVIIFTLLGLIYNTLLLFDKNYKIDREERKKVELKKWEKVTTFCTMTTLLSIILFVVLMNKRISYVYSFIYYMTIFSLYISILMNILLKKDDKKILKSELSYLTMIPIIFTLLYNIPICQELLGIIKNMCNNSIVYFIVVQTIKSFILIFFITLDFFLILVELKDLIHINKKKKVKKDLEFCEDTYVYINARGKKGIAFLINYIKDIFILIKLRVLLIIRGWYINSFKYTFKVFIKFLKKLTNNFSIYVIIMKTFSIAIIISLLLTYYKLLNLYREDVITDFYSVIITAIIIPIILNIIADLKEK